jgi:hypothetical protein
MRIIVQNSIVDYHLTNLRPTHLSTQAFELIVPRKQLGSLQESTNMTGADLWQFLLLAELLNDKVISGTEKMPGQFLKPLFTKVKIPSNIYNYLVEYYKLIYEDDNIKLDTRMNQYSRLEIGTEVFGSKISPRYAANALILANWKAPSDCTIDKYPGEVQYYFQHVIDISGIRKTHHMAFIRWFNDVKSAKIRFKQRIKDNDVSNTELWQLDFGPEGRDSIMPVHQISGRFIHVIYPGESTQYMCVVPLNRRYNL